MEINYNIISIIDIIGLVQGIVLGTLLIIINHRKKSTIFLGLALLSFCTGFVPLILQELHVTDYYPELYMLPLQNQWILVALFYIYLQKVSIFSNKKINYSLLYPGIAFYLVQIVIFFFPVQIKIDINNALWFDLLLLSGMIYSTILLIFALKLVKKHAKEVENQFSSSYKRHLNWSAHFIYCSIVLALMTMYIIFEKEHTVFRVVYSCFYTLMVFWVSIKGIMQNNVVSIIDDGEDDETTKSTEIQTNSFEISENELQKLATKINNYMSSSKVFVDSDLTIIDLAKALKEHPRRISKAINQVYRQNFNSYVNLFRIKKAEQLLLSEEVENLSMEGIGLEVGFHSKSAFYSAFKKVTGTTPTQYKNNIAA